MESKREKFVRLAEARVNRVMSEMRLISNLANKGNYDWNEDDLAQIMKALNDATKNVKRVFEKKRPVKKSAFAFEGEKPEMHDDHFEHRLLKPSRGQKYVYYNANPAGKETNDCLIRAVAVILEKRWESIARELNDYMLEQKVFDDGKVEDDYLTGKYFDKVEITKTDRKHAAIDWAKAHKQGRYCIIVRAGYGTHAIACVDGVLYDTWGSYDRYVLKVFKPKAS